MLKSLDSNNGRMAIIMPHGVLFRGSSEEEIRKNIINFNLLDAVKGLPANFFNYQKYIHIPFYKKNK